MAKKKTNKKVVEYAKLEHKVAALWTRVSTARQENENYSLENQKKVCYEYATAHGITIKREFGGKHESAATEGKMYKEMISEVAEDREINIILVVGSSPEYCSYAKFVRGIRVKSCRECREARDIISARITRSVFIVIALPTPICRQCFG